MERVLLTNGQLRKTLAAVRSLGKRGISIIVAEETRFAPSMFSRYCDIPMTCPNPGKKPEEFYNWLLRTLKKYPCDVLFPMDDNTMEIVIKYRDELEKLCRIPIPTTESYLIACDKGKTAAFARGCGVDCPDTIVPESIEQAFEAAVHLNFPVLIKPRKSNGARGIRFVEDKRDFMDRYMEVHKNFPYPIIQEYIRDGDVYEMGILYNNQGIFRASYIQKHVRRFPLDKGPSTVQETIINPIMHEMGIRMMDNLKWRGTASLEFIVDRSTKKVYLMEINPKFWNSVQVGIESGVDFPWLLYRLSMDGDIEMVKSYREGIMCRNLLPGDILHFIANKNKKGMRPGFFEFKKYHLNDDIFSKKDPAAVLGFILACLRYLFDREMWKFMFKR